MKKTYLNTIVCGLESAGMKNVRLKENNEKAVIISLLLKGTDGKRYEHNIWLKHSDTDTFHRANKILRYYGWKGDALSSILDLKNTTFPANGVEVSYTVSEWKDNNGAVVKKRQVGKILALDESILSVNQLKELDSSFAELCNGPKRMPQVQEADPNEELPI